MAPSPPEGAIDVRQVFAGADEIEVEIGFGRGMFLLERAPLIAGKGHFLGIEIKRKWAYLVAERCQKRGYGHVTIYGGDARDIFRRMTPDASVTRVFLHFPDPWWKKRHAVRRMAGDAIIDEVARMLRDGGELFIQTDVDERAHEFVAQLRKHEQLTIEGDGFIAHNPYGARSNREKRAEEDGLPIFRILARRSAR
jgi:tRNA (guanine-N7-)-methyltransferase